MHFRQKVVSLSVEMAKLKVKVSNWPNIPSTGGWECIMPIIIDDIELIMMIIYNYMYFLKDFF